MIQAKTKSKTIQVHGVPVTCYSDGSITVIDGRSGTRTRSFGTDSNGYRARMINRKLALVHRLISIAFHGPPLRGHHVDHINGDKADNRPENLRWVSHSQNLRAARKTHGRSKYRGVDARGSKWRVQVLKEYYGTYDNELEAAERWDDVAFHKHDYPLEGLNFPQRMLDKMAQDDTDNSMIDSSENAERIQTQIEMIRQESRILSYRIERMLEQRKALSEEKRQLKSELERISV